MTTMTKNTASQKQIDFINRLKAKHVWLEYNPEDVSTNAYLFQEQPEAYIAGVELAVARDMWRKGQFSMSVASQTIEALLAAPMKPTGPRYAPEGDPSADAGNDRASTWSDASEPAPEGMHKFGGVIFKVQQALHSSRLYAKALVEDVGYNSWRFEYTPGAIKNLSSSTLLSLEDAKEFGKLYGTCCACGRRLTNEDSIAAGIGPICADKF